MTNQTQKGFTLVEMLISLSILAVITAFTTANFSAARKGDEVRLSSQLVASALRRVQSAATGGELIFFCNGGARANMTCPGGTAAECPGGGTCSHEVPHGYGMHFTTVAAGAKRMIYFADINGNHAYDAGEDVRNDNVSPGVQVSASSLLIGATSVPTLDIVFDPPVPTAYFNNATSTAIASISLTHAVTAQVKSVSVNRISGQVNAN
ncbi:MAG: hypothetical protein RLZZ324_231 [Candidatus Parcubacteria bacterium]|jgi:prepilin-type N-terminal cleavage/methylation domain-containing protein